MYLPYIELKSGEIHYIPYLSPPMTAKLEEGFYTIVYSRFALMDYINNKYFYQGLEIMCKFDLKVRRDHQEEISKILDSCGGTGSEIW